MLRPTEAQIYLESRRGVTQSEGFRSLHTFNFDAYQEEGREAFGRLLAFNEETLGPGKSTTVTGIHQPTEIILLPVVGGLELIDGYEESVFIGSGESFDFLVFPESRFTIVNPYPTETIGYLLIQLSPELSVQAVDNHLEKEPLSTFSLEQKNLLIPAFSGIGEKVLGFLGRYDGRNEDEFMLRNPGNGIFAYIIEGAFEVQNRLLEKGDALSLRNLEMLEFEALSNEAILLVLEVS
jgi:quercetin 2,3-dioxygenase